MRAQVVVSFLIIAAVSGFRLFASQEKLYCQSQVASASETALVEYAKKKLGGAASIEADIFSVYGSPQSSGVFAAGKGTAKEFAVPYQVYQVQGFYRSGKKYFYVAMESSVQQGTCKVLKSAVTDELREYY